MANTDISNESKGRSDFEKLPTDILKNIFSFFKRKDLNPLALVNKDFKGLCQDRLSMLKKTYQYNIYYTVGNPIAIPIVHSNSVFSATSSKKEVEDDEIYNSFHEKNISNILLFKTEKEAFNYSLSLIQRSRNNLQQSAVFKVIYMGEVEVLPRHRKDVSITWLKEYTYNVSYYSAKRQDVIVHDGCLKVALDKKNEFKIYSSIIYADFQGWTKAEMPLSRERSRSCSVM